MDPISYKTKFELEAGQWYSDYRPVHVPAGCREQISTAGSEASNQAVAGPVFSRPAGRGDFDGFATQSDRAHS